MAKELWVSKPRHCAFGVGHQVSVRKGRHLRKLRSQVNGSTNSNNALSSYVSSTCCQAAVLFERDQVALPLAERFGAEAIESKVLAMGVLDHGWFVSKPRAHLSHLPSPQPYCLCCDPETRSRAHAFCSVRNTRSPHPRRAAPHKRQAGRMRPPSCSRVDPLRNGIAVRQHLRLSACTPHVC